ncbi:MAG: beta-L-arabinofuranosidase domain-containing protein [bacterium]
MRRTHLFSRTLLMLLALLIPSFLFSQWSIPQNAPLLTRWAKQVNPRTVLPEYPRPQMVRSVWMNLNGLWEFAEAEEHQPPPFGRTLEGKILVPYPIESALSGIMKYTNRLWYRRTVLIPKEWNNQRVLLHFGAVDWEAVVYVNGQKVGEHRGGYDPFTCDITDAMSQEGPQELIVAVFDPTNEGSQPRGKQVLKPGGIWYTPVTGIWQTVWLEPVPQNSIRELIITPDVDAKMLRLFVIGEGITAESEFKVFVYDGKKLVGEAWGKPGAEISLPISPLRLWSPTTPVLYDMVVELMQEGKKVDGVKSYFGMRKVELAKDANGCNRLMLNGKFLFQIGPLDQGFWPDGIYTAPTDEALKYDIEITKKLGFNMARKHVKVEPDRWYYWADKLGLLIWQDMPSANNKTPESKKQFELELEQLVRTHRNHPSIIMWVVFNEGWGQYDTERLSAWVKKLDPTRFVNNASGWTDKNAGSVMDIHNYPQPRSPKPEATRAIVLGEFGGLGLAIPGHTWKKEHWGYQGMSDNSQLTKKYESFLQTVHEFKDHPGLSAAVYTQTTDVEVECNGLLTYDREIIKPDLKRIALVNQGDFSNVPPSPIVKTIVPASDREPQLWHYTLEQPADVWFKKDFDDSKWKIGYGGFGTKETPNAIIGTLWNTNTIWLRRIFTLDELITKDLALWMHHDEDAEVYINGVLACKVSGWSSEYEQSELTAEGKAALKKGANVLAVYCKQTRGGQYIDLGIIRLLPGKKKTTKGAICEVKNVPHAMAANRNGLYTSNREPLAQSPFMKLPIGSITPKGWIRGMLEIEKEGMTGRLKEISPWLNFEKSAWGNSRGEGERGWEELPYWLKGYGDLGYVLKDEAIIKETRTWIEAVLSSQREDGWFGPRSLLTSLQGKPDLWPHMVMLNILQSFYEYTGDKRVLPLMLKYFRWENQLPPESFGAGYWPKIRMGDNIESLYWAYNRTGESWLLDLAAKMHKNMAHWEDDVINWHNVNVAQGFREPTVYFQQSQEQKHLYGAERNYRKVMDLFGQFPGGGFAADENARPGFDDPRQGFETCGIVEFMHSFQMLTKITGTPIWSDRCEDITFNSLPAAMTPDQKGLRYLTCANEIQLDKESKSPGVQNGGTMMSYSPFQVYRCCQHNVSHGWPYFAEELWLATSDRGLCASIYSASEVRAKVGDGTIITLAEETEYPFSNTVTLNLTTPKSVNFPLYLRIPRWSKNTVVRINGIAVESTIDPLSYLKIHRQWQNGDVVTLTFDMHVTVQTWEKNENSVSVNYGPLSFALKIDERWQKYGSNEQWPEWEVFPASPWNYGLLFDDTNPAASFKLVRKTGALAHQPFTLETVPIQLNAKGRKLANWQQDYLGLAGLLQQSPARTTAPEETITLIPMGAARLRIASFPTVTKSGEGHEWIPPQRPKQISYKITSSYVNQYDDIKAVADGFEPKSSNDESIARMTWWAHKGTNEWVQYDFPAPKKIKTVSVYWYDDGSDGECRVPQSWKVLYKKGDGWIPIEQLAEYGTRKDAWNTVSCREIETTGVRLEVELQKNFCGGILEWKVE